MSPSATYGSHKKSDVQDEVTWMQRDWDEADGMNHGVYSKDTVMHGDELADNFAKYTQNSVK